MGFQVMIVSVNLRKLLIIYCLANISTSDGVEEDINTNTKDDSKNRKLSSLDIDYSLNDLRQDDPKLIKILKDRYLIPPSNMPYNFSSPSVELDGQFGQPSYVSKTFFRYIVT